MEVNKAMDRYNGTMDNALVLRRFISNLKTSDYSQQRRYLDLIASPERIPVPHAQLTAKHRVN